MLAQSQQHPLACLRIEGELLSLSVASIQFTGTPKHAQKLSLRVCLCSQVCVCIWSLSVCVCICICVSVSSVCVRLCVSEWLSLFLSASPPLSPVSVSVLLLCIRFFQQTGLQLPKQDQTKKKTQRKQRTATACKHLPFLTPYPHDHPHHPPPPHHHHPLPYPPPLWAAPPCGA